MHNHTKYREALASQGGWEPNPYAAIAYRVDRSGGLRRYLRYTHLVGSLCLIPRYQSYIRNTLCLRQTNYRPVYSGSQLNALDADRKQVRTTTKLLYQVPKVCTIGSLYDSTMHHFDPILVVSRTDFTNDSPSSPIIIADCRTAQFFR
jgi:hypothetical protein